jgi:hypothetical protein
MNFYLALGCMKLATVLLGVIARAVQAPGRAELAACGAAIPALIQRAHDFLDDRGTELLR